MTGCADSEAFRSRLLADAGVAVLADTHFGRRVPNDGQHIRFSYATSPDAIRKGIERIDAFVRKDAHDDIAAKPDAPSAPPARRPARR